MRLVRWLVWWSSNDDTVWYYSSFRHSTYTSADILQTNVSICYQSITAKVSFDGSIITIIIGINNPPPIHCAGKCIVNYLTSSDPHRGILSDILSGTPSDILSVILSDIYSHILSGILFFLAFYLAFILTFCLASFRHSGPGVPQHPGLAIWCLHSAERKGEWWQEEKQSGRWSCAFVTIWQVEKNQFTDHCPANDRDFPYEIMSSLSKMRWQSNLSNQTAHYLGSEQARTWFWSRPSLPKIEYGVTASRTSMKMFFAWDGIGEFKALTNTRHEVDWKGYNLPTDWLRPNAWSPTSVVLWFKTLTP